MNRDRTQREAAYQIRTIARLRKQRIMFGFALPGAALDDSLAPGYYISPLTGLSFSGFAESRVFDSSSFFRWMYPITPTAATPSAAN